MLSSIAGIDQITLPNSAAYVSHWIKVLKGDARLAVTAAAQAQRAADHVRHVQHTAEDTVQLAA
jgi:antirestriction protein ArdC